MKQPIVATGGAATIGSHTGVELLAAGHEVVVLDNMSNSRHSVLEPRMEPERAAVGCRFRTPQLPSSSQAEEGSAEGRGLVGIQPVRWGRSAGMAHGAIVVRAFACWHC